MAAQAVNYYAVLGLPAFASPAEIRRSHRRLMKIWHPDVNASPEAPERAKLLNAAFETLSDARRRAAHDQALRATLGREGIAAARARPPDAADPRRESGDRRGHAGADGGRPRSSPRAERDRRLRQEFEEEVRRKLRDRRAAEARAQQRAEEQRQQRAADQARREAERHARASAPPPAGAGQADRTGRVEGAHAPRAVGDGGATATGELAWTDRGFVPGHRYARNGVVYEVLGVRGDRVDIRDARGAETWYMRDVLWAEWQEEIKRRGAAGVGAVRTGAGGALSDEAVMQAIWRLAHNGDADAVARTLAQAGWATREDQRPKGGRLWLIPRPDKAAQLQKVIDSLPFPSGAFRYSEQGHRATGNRPAWYFHPGHRP